MHSQCASRNVSVAPVALAAPGNATQHTTRTVHVRVRTGVAEVVHVAAVHIAARIKLKTSAYSLESRTCTSTFCELEDNGRLRTARPQHNTPRKGQKRSRKGQETALGMSRVFSHKTMMTVTSKRVHGAHDVGRRHMIQRHTALRTVNCAPWDRTLAPDE